MVVIWTNQLSQPVTRSCPTATSCSPATSESARIASS